VTTAIKALNQAEYRVAVVTNQPVVARGEITEEQLGRIHASLETALGASGAFVDGIYCCPHHPHRGFVGERPELKIDCDCRKPKDGLLRRAAEDLNADLGRSWVVGDSTTDVALANGAGVRSILVATGEGGADGKYSAQPDFTACDFGAAVSFICDIHPRVSAALAELLPTIGPAQSVLLSGGPAARIVARIVAHRFEAEGVAAAELLAGDDGTFVRRAPDNHRGILTPALDTARVADEVRRPDWGSTQGAIRIRVKQSAESELAWSRLGYFNDAPVRRDRQTGHFRDGGEVVFDLDNILGFAGVAS
jgi:histidinol-phosphate phosphatase family protein